MRDVLSGEPVLPAFVEIYPVLHCNHGCTFCISESDRAPRVFFPWDRLRTILAELKNGGTKVVRFSGGGEPLLHPQRAAMLAECARLQLPALLVTNGSLLAGQMVPLVVRTCRGVKISLDAGTESAYMAVHRVKKGTFDQVLENVAALTSLVRASGAACFVELSFVICEANYKTLDSFLALAGALGVDDATVSTDTRAPSDDNRFYWEHAKAIVRSHQTVSGVRIRAQESTPDDFMRDCDLFCPISLFTGLITSSADFYVSCHHVRFAHHCLGNASQAAVVQVLRRSRAVEYRGRYAFGVGEKSRKLLASDANLALVRMLKLDDGAKALLKSARPMWLDGPRG